MKKISSNRIKEAPQLLKTALICVDSYEKKLITGRIYYRELGWQKSFSSLMELILLIESAVNLHEFPDWYMKAKEFSRQLFSEPPKQSMALEKHKESIERGKLETFRLNIIFKQNTSWQGIITLVNGKKENSFKSELELLNLMDRALTNALCTKRTKKQMQAPQYLSNQLL